MNILGMLNSEDSMHGIVINKDLWKMFKKKLKIFFSPDLLIR